MRKIGNVLVSIGEDSDGKKFACKIGVSFDSNGTSFVRLHALPMPKLDNKGYPEAWLKIEPDTGSYPRRKAQPPKPQREAPPPFPKDDAPQTPGPNSPMTL